jgi:PAS domain S-box-containing protein
VARALERDRGAKPSTHQNYRYLLGKLLTGTGANRRKVMESSFRVDSGCVHVRARTLWSNGSKRSGARVGRSRPRSVDSVALRLLLPGVALAVLLVAAFFAQRDATSTLSQNVLTQARAEQEVSLAYKSETLLLDLETGVRGFLLTHDRRFLEPWQSARAAFPVSSSALVGLEAHNGNTDLSLARTIARDGESYIRDFAIPQILEVENHPQNVSSLAAALQGKRRVDALRVTFTKLIQRDQQPAAPAEQRAQAASGRAAAYELAGLLGALVLLAVSAIYLRRAVLGPILRVGKVADEIAAGDLSVRVEPASATELSRLANSFNTMADAVQDGRASREDALTKLRRSDVFLNSVLEHIPNMLLVRDASDLRFVRFNRAGEQMLGYSRDELLGKNAQEVFAADDADSITAEDRATLASGVPLDIPEEAIQTRNNGVRYLHTIKIPVIDEHGEPQYLLGISEDITERKHADQLLRDAMKEAERANGAKSEFLSRMSHELRTPLNSILGFGRLLEMDGLSEEQREPVHYILESGRHLLQLINEVLDIARIEAGNVTIFPEPVAVEALLRDVVAVVAPIAAERSIRVEIESPGPECQVRADPQRVKQVLLNLLSNAIKYNREGGEVNIACERAGPNLRICVRDTGCGIPADRLSDVFEPFERLSTGHENIEGAGLGLALSEHLMELMGGTLTVQSEPGVGSAFTAELELAEQSDALAPIERSFEITERDRSDAAPKARLLYVEDNVANIKLIERVLGHRPEIAVEATLQGRLGIELARHHPPDVILLDLHLPDLTGEQVLDALKSDARTARIPVIILTADVSADQATRVLNLGASAFLTKPLDVPGFLDTLDEVLLAGSLVPE